MRVASQKRGEVSRLRLQEFGQALGGAETLPQGEHVRQVVASHERSQLGRVVGRRRVIGADLDVELFVDFLPGGILVQGGRRADRRAWLK